MINNEKNITEGQGELHHHLRPAILFRSCPQPLLPLLVGRLVMVKHDGTNSLSIFPNCNDKATEFIQTFVAYMMMPCILAPPYIPPIVQSFPLNKKLAQDGHSKPFLAIQVIEPANNGIFSGLTSTAMPSTGGGWLQSKAGREQRGQQGYHLFCA